MPKKQNLCRVGHSFSYELDMKLQIDNFDGRGPSDYTSAIDASRAPRVVRRLNKPDELQLSLIADRPDFIVPSNGARITLGRSNGEDVFTGYLTQAPAFEYLGWGERGPVYRYNLVAQGDEVLLDRKQIPNSPPFVDRSAGDALRQLTEDLLPASSIPQRCRMWMRSRITLPVRRRNGQSTRLKSHCEREPFTAL